MKRKILTLLLALGMVLAYSIPALNPDIQVYATSKTANEAIAWVQSQVGKSIDYDGVEGAQCVDLIKAYYNYLGVSPVLGNGVDYTTNSLPSGWTRVQGGTPQKGDILVYTGGPKGYGHVGIYEANYITYHQNVSNQQKVLKITEWAYNGFETPYWGYIRPNWSNAPTPYNAGDNFYANLGVYDEEAGAYKSMGINKNNSYNVGFVGGNDPTTDEGKVKSDTFKTRFWHYQRNSDGSYRISNCLYTDYYLTAAGTSAGSNVKVTSGYQNTASQKWFFYQDGAYIYCKSAASDYYLWYNQSCNLQLEPKNDSRKPSEKISLYHFDPISGSTTLTVNATTTDKATVFTWTKPTGDVAWYNIQIRRLDSAGNEISNEYDQMNMIADNTKTSFTKNVSITTPGNYTAICYPHSWVNYVASERIYFTVEEAGPKITSQPKNVTTSVGGKVSISVTATGTGLTYQWQTQVSGSTTWSNTSLNGNTTPTMSFKPGTNLNGRKYRCVITDKNGVKVYSNAATLTVVDGPAITTQPKNVTTSVGGSVSISVKATGTGLTYQWQTQVSGSTTWSNTSLNGNTTPTMSFKPGTNLNGRKYRCLITDKYGVKIYSNAVTLTVVAGPTITKQPKDVSAIVGDKVTISVTATGANLTYQWQTQVSGSGTWSNTSLNGNKTAAMSFKPGTNLNGRKYRCLITDEYGVKIYSNAVTLTVTSGVIKITTQPKDVTASVGEKVEISVKATGGQGTLKYQWQTQVSGSSAWGNTSLNGSNTPTLSFKPGTNLNGRKYRCHITDAAGNEAYSNAVTLKIVTKGMITEQTQDDTVNN